jgi:hypothetical protein
MLFHGVVKPFIPCSRRENKAYPTTGGHKHRILKSTDETMKNLHSLAQTAMKQTCKMKE